MTDPFAADVAVVSDLIGDSAGEWDIAGELPRDVLAKLGAMGLLCAEVPTRYGGRGGSSLANGEFTAHVGSLCTSVRSIMTSQGIAAATIGRFGDRAQRKRFLGELVGGQLAAVGFSEPASGSDLAAMRTTIVQDGEDVVINGAKKWVTGTYYADYVVVYGKFDSAGDDVAAAVMVPTNSPGLHIERIPHPMGCRAAGHCNFVLDQVRLPKEYVLGGGGQPLSMLFTTALSYGRMSVAWGCVGIVRACLGAAKDYARTREQGGQVLAEHQLIAGHIAQLFVAERVSTQICSYASESWDANSPQMIGNAVLAKHVSAGHAAQASSTAVQVLAASGSEDGHVVARAYRDSKLMEIIEGSNEISQLILAQHALSLPQ